MSGSPSEFVAEQGDSQQIRMGRSTPSRYADLTREELAVVVPELLLMGQLIDRSGMAWCISAFGREQMAQVAIEEWMGASPIYTLRMQKALKYQGDVSPTLGS